MNVRREFASRFGALAAAIDCDEVARGTYYEERDGRELGCLIARLAPEGRFVRCYDNAPSTVDYNIDLCPAWLMPRWMARLTPLIDDLGCDERWRDHLRLYAGLGRRWHRLEARDWRYVRYAYIHELTSAMVSFPENRRALLSLPAVYSSVTDHTARMLESEPGDNRKFPELEDAESPGALLVEDKIRKHGPTFPLACWISDVFNDDESTSPGELLEDIADRCPGWRNKNRLQDRMIDKFFEILEMRISQAETRHLRAMPALQPELTGAV